ncbi:MAG: recombination mediator RecR [Bacteroidota bacterium]|nr:recombination mediator RecR [Bacteroidota bacterium]
MNIPSKLVEEAVNELSKFPGIGKKSALRMVLHLLKSDAETSVKLGKAIVNMRTQILFCTQCGNVSDKDVCGICSSVNRDREKICVVEDLRDIMAIESTGQFSGLYHVLGGVLSPIEGIGPSDLNIDKLMERIKTEETKELIMALSPTVEGDSTMFYLTKKLQSPAADAIKITTISRGIAIGGSLEYADEITLGRSILNRIGLEV